MKLFDDKYVTISLDEKVPCLEWVGKGYMPSKAFRTSEEKSLQFYLQHKDKYPKLGWFVDSRKVQALSTDDTQWVVDEILPKFASAGLKKEAFVVAASAIGKLVIKNYRSTAGKLIEIKVFDTVDAAKKWLKE